MWFLFINIPKLFISTKLILKTTIESKNINHQFSWNIDYRRENRCYITLYFTQKKIIGVIIARVQKKYPSGKFMLIIQFFRFLQFLHYFQSPCFFKMMLHNLLHHQVYFRNRPSIPYFCNLSTFGAKNNRNI